MHSETMEKLRELQQLMGEQEKLLVNHVEGLKLQNKELSRVVRNLIGVKKQTLDANQHRKVHSQVFIDSAGLMANRSTIVNPVRRQKSLAADHIPFKKEILPFLSYSHQASMASPIEESEASKSYISQGETKSDDFSQRNANSRAHYKKASMTSPKPEIHSQKNIADDHLKNTNSIIQKDITCGEADSQPPYSSEIYQTKKQCRSIHTESKKKQNDIFAIYKQWVRPQSSGIKAKTIKPINSKVSSIRDRPSLNSRNAYPEKEVTFKAEVIKACESFLKKQKASPNILLNKCESMEMSRPVEHSRPLQNLSKEFSKTTASFYSFVKNKQNN